MSCSHQNHIGRYLKKESPKKHTYVETNANFMLELVNKMESILEKSKVLFKTKMRKILTIKLKLDWTKVFRMWLANNKREW